MWYTLIFTNVAGLPGSVKPHGVLAVSFSGFVLLLGERTR